MNTFEIVTIGVSVGGLLASLTPPFRPRFADFGRQGTMWIEHAEDRQTSELPSEDALDAPIPRRPLRSRFG